MCSDNMTQVVLRAFSIPNTKLRASSIYISESDLDQILKFCVLTVQQISNKSVQFSMLLAERFLCNSTLKIVENRKKNKF